MRGFYFNKCNLNNVIMPTENNENVFHDSISLSLAEATGGKDLSVITISSRSAAAPYPVCPGNAL